MFADDLITYKQAAELVGVHWQTVRRWTVEGKIRLFRIVGRRRVSRQEVLALVESEAGPCPIETRAAFERRQQDIEQRLEAVGIK